MEMLPSRTGYGSRTTLIGFSDNLRSTNFEPGSGQGSRPSSGAAPLLSCKKMVGAACGYFTYQPLPAFDPKSKPSSRGARQDAGVVSLGPRRRDYEPPCLPEEPLSSQSRARPRELVSVGTCCVRESTQREQAYLPLHWLLLMPLVPRDATGEL